MNMLSKILAEQPKFHKGETEVRRAFPVEETYLPNSAALKLEQGVEAYLGIGPDVAEFIYELTTPKCKTLETGAGISTLIFALKRSKHIVITPNETEIFAIKEYAAAKKIEVDTITFVCKESEQYLPECTVDDLDIVLIDGKHAFPWPMLDWFYTAGKLKERGFMILDDAQLISVGILRDFMAEDPKWKLYKSFGDKTFVFQKIHTIVHDVAWHMQPYIMNRLTEGTREWCKTLGGNA